MKKLIIVCLVLCGSMLKAQDSTNVENLSAKLMPLYNVDSSAITFNQTNFGSRKLKSYILTFSFKATGIPVNSKIYFKLGTDQDSMQVLNEKAKVVEHQVNQIPLKCVHSDDDQNKEYNLINGDIINISYEITPQQYMDANWLTVYTSFNQQVSTKEYYQIKE